MRIQHLDSGQSIQVNMLSQIDISETAAPQQMKQAIIPKLLSRAICHACSPCQHLSSFIVDVQYTGNCMGREASCQESMATARVATTILRLLPVFVYGSGDPRSRHALCARL